MIMKMNKVLLIVLITVTSVALYAQKPVQNKKDLESRVEMLEDYKSNVQIAFDAKAENLKKYIDDEVKKEMVKVDDAKDALDLILWFGLPTTLLTFAGGWFGLLWKTKKMVTEKIAVIVEKERDAILRVVETESFDNKLRTKKELLVISASEESQASILAFLRKLKFKNIKGRIVGEFDELPEHDLMIFNTPDDSIEQSTINELIEKYDDEDTIFVAYTGKNLERNARMNFSNSPFTLYHNILSALKYSEIARLVDEENV